MKGFLLGPWYIDELTLKAVSDELEVPLSSNELGVLRYLYDHREGPVSKEVLQQEVLGYNPGVKSRAMDSCLIRLRKKLEDHPSQPSLFGRRYGQGVHLKQARDGTREAEAPVAPPMGREQLVVELRQRLAQPGLVTLVGPSGIGKTFLARHIQEVLRGIWVDLGQVQGVEQLRDEVAAALECGPKEVQHGLGERLLVLDNFEALPDSAALEVGRWTGRILVTSVRPLGLDQEAVVRVPELDPAAAEALLRAQADRLDLKLEPRHVARAIEAVGGHPLALVLLAPVVADLALLTAKEVLEVETDRVDAPDRHLSLGAALERAAGFLSPEARRLLAVMSVFSGDARLDAVAVVAERKRAQTLKLLRELERHGFLQHLGEFYRLPAAVALFARPLLQTKTRLRRFLKSLWFSGLEKGSPWVSPYRNDIVREALASDGREFVGLCGLAVLSGSVDSRMLASARARVERGDQPHANHLGLVSVLSRMKGLSGPYLDEVRARIGALEQHTALTLCEVPRSIDLAEVLGLEPSPLAPDWVILLTGMESRCRDSGFDEMLERAKLGCVQRGWHHGHDDLQSLQAIRALRRGDLEHSSRLLRDLPTAQLSPQAVITLVLASWGLDRKAEARRLVRWAVERQERSGAQPYHLMALRSVEAGLAWMAEDAAAVEFAKTALNTDRGGDGLEMSVVASLVLVLAGEANHTGLPTLDAALAGQPWNRTGMLGQLVAWMLPS